MPSAIAKPNAERAEGSATVSGRHWEVVTATEAGLAFPLPDATGWMLEGQGYWWHARHAATHSELFARTWKAPRSSTPESCEAQARLWKPDLPIAPREAVVEARRLETPPGYVTRVTVSTGPGARRSMLAGHVTAFGGTIGECVAVIYATQASGPSADRVVGARLATFVSGVMPRVQRLTVDDRARSARKQTW